MVISFKAPVFFAATLSLSGCASTGRVDKLDTDIRQLRERNAEAKREIAVVVSQLAHLQLQISDIAQALAKQSQNDLESGRAVQVQLESLQKRNMQTKREVRIATKLLQESTMDSKREVDVAVTKLALLQIEISRIATALAESGKTDADARRVLLEKLASLQQALTDVQGKLNTL